MSHRHLALAVLLSAAGAAPAIAGTRQRNRDQSAVPKSVELSPAVEAAVSDPVLDKKEKRTLRIFHGRFDAMEEGTKKRPRVLFRRWKVRSEALQGEGVPALLRARAAVRRGEMEVAVDALDGKTGPRARLVRGRALARLGRFSAAAQVLAPVRKTLRGDGFDDAEKLTAAAQALSRLAKLQGRPGRDHQRAVDLLGRVRQEHDRLYWPALVAQGRILYRKHNSREATEALKTALTLNPNASRAWYFLGRIALDQFDFDGVERAVERLRRINADHVLAHVLEVESLLTQKKVRQARKAVEKGLDRFPRHRRLLACRAAVAALSYDRPAMEKAFRAFDEISGEHPLALRVTGKYLSFARQYGLAEKILRRAIDRRPDWPAARAELGHLLSQAGKNEEAKEALSKAVELDPYNRRAKNTLKLTRQILGYRTLETEHFIIRYKRGVDEVLAREMRPVVERIYDEVTAAFGYRPERKTQIEIHPNKKRFAVRITGMPWIWTIGASTGPVIALTAPRIGKGLEGPFDWARVIRHEFTHTVTLGRTKNRSPHWLTEACAVSQEQGPRTYKTARLLAHSLEKGGLFSLSEINWAFVRPEKPTDRQLAYAQARWMLEYITHTFGHRTVLKMLDLARKGVPQGRLIPEATGRSAERFLAGFRKWARKEVEQWGLAPEPPERVLRKKLRGAENPSARVKKLLRKHPKHPTVLKIKAQATLRKGSKKEAYRAITEYAEARPVDPWADRKLADVLLALGRLKEAAAYLQQLDRLHQKDGSYARRLVRVRKKLGRPEAAYRAIERVLRRKPYNPKMREEAATLLLRRDKKRAALRHIRALTKIEPDRAVHYARLAALHAKMGQPEKAEKAARKARAKDPDAPVGRFLSSGGDSG